MIEEQEAAGAGQQKNTGRESKKDGAGDVDSESEIKREAETNKRHRHDNKVKGHDSWRTLVS